MARFPRWLVIYEGTSEASPIVRMEVEFRAAEGYEEEYVRKVERALAPAIQVYTGPWPLDLIGMRT